MPKLGDVLGALLSDVARARVRADLEATRIAEAYSRDPVMKHLSVPRFRLPEIVVDLPVVVTNLDVPDKTRGGRPVGEPTGTEIRQAVREALTAADLTLTRSEVEKVSAAAVKRSSRLFGSEDVQNLTAGKVTADYAFAVVEGVKAVRGSDIDDEHMSAVERATRAVMAPLVASRLPAPPSLDVGVTAGELNAQTGGDSVVRLRLTIAEDAYEMVSRDDGEGYQLTPE